MANVDRPNGLVPVGTQGSGPWNGQVNAYYTSDASAVFIGDLVKLTGTSAAAGTMVNGQDVSGMPSVTVAAAADITLAGVAVGFSPLQTNQNLGSLHKAASESRIVYVSDDPRTIYEIQEDSTGNNIDKDMVGLSTDVVATAGSSTTDISAHELDSSETATAGGQLRILGLARRPDNEIGTNAKWLVMINFAESVWTVTTDV